MYDSSKSISILIRGKRYSHGPEHAICPCERIGLPLPEQLSSTREPNLSHTWRRALSTPGWTRSAGSGWLKGGHRGAAGWLLSSPGWVVLQAVAGAKAGIEALLGPPAEVRVAAAAPGDTLQRWGEVFSTVQVAASCIVHG